MKMKIPWFIVLGGGLLTIGMIRAEEPPEKPSLPPGPPVVTQMPDFAQWSIDYVYADSPDGGVPSAAPGSTVAAGRDGLQEENIKGLSLGANISGMRPLHVVITKTGDIRHEEWSLEKNGTKEIWAMGDVVVTRSSIIPGLIPSNMAGMGGDTFPELAWLSKEDFVGYEDEAGRKCLAFKKNWYSDEHVFLGTSIAHIDPDSRYPVSFQFADQTRHYTILRPAQRGRDGGGIGAGIPESASGKRITC